jgi:hypothetical protein
MVNGMPRNVSNSNQATILDRIVLFADSNFTNSTKLECRLQCSQSDHEAMSVGAATRRWHFLTVWGQSNGLSITFVGSVT